MNPYVSHLGVRPRIPDTGTVYVSFGQIVARNERELRDWILENHRDYFESIFDMDHPDMVVDGVQCSPSEVLRMMGEDVYRAQMEEWIDGELGDEDEMYILGIEEVVMDVDDSTNLPDTPLPITKNRKGRTR